jgi:hypothetical protein
LALARRDAQVADIGVHVTHLAANLADEVMV